MKVSLLQQYIQQSGSTDAGVREYGADVTARYPRKAEPPTELTREVACHWRITYMSKGNVALSLLALPLLLLGHLFVAKKTMRFVTWHYLTLGEVRRFKQQRLLKGVLLPLAILGMLGLGIVFVIVLIATIVSVFHLAGPEPGQPEPKYGGVFLLATALLPLPIIAIIKAQRRLSKMGEPPSTTEFEDQRVLLDSVSRK